MTDLSLDIETMGTEPGAAVVGIGAAFFDANTGHIDNGFYRAIHLATACDVGLHIDPATVIWWLGQSDDVRNAIRFSAIPIRDALNDFIEYIGQHCAISDVRPWMRGPSFDGSLLRIAYEKCGIPAPWRYWNERCHRTLTARNPNVEQPERQGALHNALDDAKHQARWLIKIAEHHRARVGR